MRTGHQDKAEVKADIQEIFKESLSHDPFEEMTQAQVNANPRMFTPPAEGPGGPGWILYVKAEKVPTLEVLRKKLADSDDVKKMLIKCDPNFILEEMPGAPEGLKKFKMTLTKEDSTREGLRTRLQDTLKNVLLAELAQTPFLAEDNIGAAVAGELRNSTIWAMLISWAGIIIYLAIRFEWRYGVAAVIALIHDALIAIGFTSLAGAVVPKSWGLSFDMNMTTLAAVLTIIGYSVNDTIVVFDRIRENLHTMKKQTFAEIINLSVNQTLSRTILTSFTVWITCVVLYAVTATTGGGIAEFSFPLIIGVLVGTYSSVYVAAPIVLWWYKGQKPAST
jgi:preprotein translocase subunit SecF